MQQTNAKAYPLAWPGGRPRTKTRANAPNFKRKLGSAWAALRDELNRLHASYVVISSNVPLKANGEPYSDPGRLPDPGVAVYFRLKEKPYVLCCDRWQLLEQNVSALVLHINAMRGMERWGVATTEETFAGFKELPATASGENWWDVLQCTPDAGEETIQLHYKSRLRAAHPDVGGSMDAMTRLNTARDSALAARRA